MHYVENLCLVPIHTRVPLTSLVNVTKFYLQNPIMFWLKWTIMLSISNRLLASYKYYYIVWWVMNYLAASYEVSTACNLYKITQQAAGN